MNGFLQMRIKISNLVDGEHHFSFEESINSIELEEPFFGDFKSEVKLSKIHSQIILESHTIVYAKFECDRCGTEYTAALENEYEMVYLMNEREEESQSINISYLSPDAAYIDIKDDLREYALLSIPMKKLCDPSCKGLCFRCGGDLNLDECNCTEPKIDPRWLKLDELKNKINNKNKVE